MRLVEVVLLAGHRGDRGNDNITGAWAPPFADAGIGRTTDCRVAVGHRVHLDAKAYTLIQVGSHAGLTMGNGNQLILAGVSMSSRTRGRIFRGLRPSFETPQIVGMRLTAGEGRWIEHPRKFSSVSNQLKPRLFLVAAPFPRRRPR